jgi:TM2 domain-containing membrane protein YozV
LNIKIGSMGEQKPAQSKSTMILISFFLGGLGIHRLMMGYSNWWLMLITLGGCGIWALIDFIKIVTGNMKMADGSELI